MTANNENNRCQSKKEEINYSCLKLLIFTLTHNPFSINRKTIEQPGTTRAFECLLTTAPAEM